MDKGDDFNLPDDLRTISDFDRGNGTAALPTTAANTETAIGKNFARNSVPSVLIESLVEHLCSFYESDPKRKKLLFNALCEKLHKMVAISTPTYNIESLSPLRSQYQHAFVRLIKVTQGSINATLPPLPPPVNPLSPCQTMKNIFHFSRYASEFEEIAFIAKGGFGSVFKAKNKLDGVEYAIKKILLKYQDTKLFVKILREVTTLAKLNHPNIVYYKTAWLEPRLDCARSDNQRSSEEFSVDSSGNYRVTTGSSSQRTRDSSSEMPSTYLNDDSVSSAGVVFEIEESLRQKACSVVELNEISDDVEDDLDVPRVVGQAATPPGRSSVDFSQFKSKFWAADDESCDKESVSVRSKRVTFQSEENKVTKRMSTEIVQNTYWATSVVKKETQAISQMFLDRGLVKAKDIGKAEKTFEGDKAVLYVQMQLCEDTLRAWIDRRNESGIVNIGDCYLLFRQVLSGVNYIHTKAGIIHRDLKPRNIFVTGPDLHIQIGDFGLAVEDIQDHVVQSTTPESGRSTPLLNSGRKSRHTSGVGTQAYAAPEQLGQQGAIDIDSKSDMYSLGIILFELFHPFSTVMERSKAITDLRKGIIPPIFTERFPAISKSVAQLLNPIPSLRPSASELLRSTFSENAEERIRLKEETSLLKETVNEQKERICEQEELIQSQAKEIERLKALLLATRD